MMMNIFFFIRNKDNSNCKNLNENLATAWTVSVTKWKRYIVCYNSCKEIRSLNCEYQWKWLYDGSKDIEYSSSNSQTNGYYNHHHNNNHWKCSTFSWLPGCNAKIVKHIKEKKRTSKLLDVDDSLVC